MISAMLKAVFFIPSYYDSNSFLRLRAQVLSHWSFAVAPEFRLLDDSCGEDPGLKKVEGLSQTKLYSFKQHLGHQKLLVEGIRAFCAENASDAQSEYTLLITMDGDGEDRPEDVIRLVKEWIDQSEKDPLVVAKRKDLKKRSIYGFARNRYREIFFLLTGMKWETGNFAAFSLAAAKKFIFHEDFHWSYASSLIKHASHIVILACERGPRWEGKTKMGLVAWLYHGYLLLRPHRSRILERLSFTR